MMNEFLFHVSIFALGMPFCLLAAPRLGIYSCCLQAYPIGLTLWVSISLVILHTGLPFDAVVVFGCTAFVGAIGVGLKIRTHCVSRENSGMADPYRLIPSLLVASTLFVVLAGLVMQFDVSIWTYDSHTLVAIARSIANSGGLEREMGIALTSRGVFQVLVQATSIFLDRTYLTANPAILAICFTGIFILLGVRGLSHGTAPSLRSIAITLLTVAAFVTPYFFIAQVFYIHETFTAAVYLFLAATAFWFAELEREPLWLPFAFFHLFAFSLQRVDGPVVAMILLVIACSTSRLPAQQIHKGMLIYCGASLAWLGALMSMCVPGGEWVLRPAKALLDPSRIGAMIAAYLSVAGVLILIRHPRADRLRDWIPLLVLAFILCVIIAGALWRPSFAEEAVVAMIGNTASMSWGGIWYVFAVLGALSLLLPKVPHRYILAHGSIAAFLFILALAPTQHFRVGWADSSNRMMTYLIPIFGFYILMAFGRALVSSGRDKCQQT